MVPPAMKHSILIVDDQPENVNLLVNILGADHALHRARTGAAALEILRRRPVDMILTDQRMPGMTGVELLEKAREIRPDGVRILITAYPDVTNAILAINRGHVSRYIAKPFDPGELRALVAEQLARRDLVLENRRMSEVLRRTVEDLSRANRELVELHKIKDEFLANCSHELKTPLVSGMGYIDLFLSGGLGSLEARQEKGLRVAYRNLERLLALIENLLTMARRRIRPDEVRLRRFPLQALVEECVESLRARARKKSLRVRVAAPGGWPVVRADERKIHSVLTNVLSNAEKFTPDRARIDIRVDPPQGGRCRVTVTDNGIGLSGSSGEVRAFKTTQDPRYKGLGIGLMLARQILQAHGGDIVLGPGRRSGAVVRFDLPVAER